MVYLREKVTRYRKFMVYLREKVTLYGRFMVRLIEKVTLRAVHGLPHREIKLFHV